MPHLSELLARNRAWAARQVAGDAGYFQRLTDIQRPDYLWIGCSDSRVPANQIVDLDPGQMFVHRNVANQVSPGDANGMAVVTYAVEVLEVRGIIVCGHYGCGGVRAALLGQRVGLVDNWLRHVGDVRDKHHVWLEALPSQELQLQALCELNVLEQARNVCGTTVVQDAWARGQEVVVHGWVYGLHNGLLEDLKLTVGASGDVAAAYGLALGAIKSRFERQRRELGATAAGS